VTKAGGRGIAVRVDHLVLAEVRALVQRIESESGALHLLVNDIFGATHIEWNKTVWQSDLEYGLRLLRLGIDTHAITSHYAIPLLLKHPGGLLVEVNDGTREYNAAVVALASDAKMSRWHGQSLSCGALAREYGFTDVDGSQPDAWRYLIEVQEAGKPADVTGYR
jgi:NAD(P)-dependent dehydrogenase (short-subunit alcohol dehydrogenase family)